MKKVLRAAAALLIAAIGSTGAQAPLPDRSDSDAPVAYQAMVTNATASTVTTRSPLPAGAPLVPTRPTSPIRAPTRHVGTSRQEARCRRNASARIADARSRRTDQVPIRADHEPRQRGREEKQSGPLRPAPSQSDGVRQRSSRSAGCQSRRCGTSAERRRRLRFRQHRVRAEDVAAAARRLPHRRIAHQRPRGRRCGSRIRERRPFRSALSSRRTSTWTDCRSARAAARWFVTTSPRTASTCSTGRLLRHRCRRLRRRRRPRHAVSIHRHGRWRAGLFRAQSAARKDHESSSKNIVISREEVDKRMTSPRIKVTAGPHDVGFTFIERPAQEQNVWQPSLRDSLEAHNPSGHSETADGKHRRSVQRHRHQRDPVAEAPLHLQADVGREEAPCAAEILSAVARRAFRRPVIEADIEAPMAFYNDARKDGGDFDAGIRAGLARILASPAFVFRSESDPASLAAGAAHRITDLELASPSFVLPVEQHSRR